MGPGTTSASNARRHRQAARSPGDQVVGDECNSVAPACIIGLTGARVDSNYQSARHERETSRSRFHKERPRGQRRQLLGTPPSTCSLYGATGHGRPRHRAAAIGHGHCFRTYRAKVRRPGCVHVAARRPVSHVNERRAATCDADKPTRAGVHTTTEASADQCGVPPLRYTIGERRNSRARADPTQNVWGEGARRAYTYSRRPPASRRRTGGSGTGCRYTFK
jgi:hypothetical protein